MNPQRNFYRIVGGVQHYAWGETRENAPGGMPYIASLLGQQPGDSPWAELWLGAHPKLPSRCVVGDGSEQALSQMISVSPDFWIGGRAIEGTGEAQLPYLLKVLTCRHPLSIQSHPDKQTAGKLHAASPELYPDANDKAEVMIALGDFEAMVGFRNATVVREDLQRFRKTDVLKGLLAQAGESLSFLELCRRLFDLSAIQVAALLSGMEMELQGEGFELRDADHLFLRLLSEYPGDRGVFFAYLLNHVRLSSGEAVFLEPNSPHAYMDGCGIECMSNSDNVIRAGLTPKPVDVPRLLETVDFAKTGARLILPEKKTAGAGKIDRYVLPTPKFEVIFVHDGTADLADFGEGCVIMLVLEGRFAIRSAEGDETAAPGEAFVFPAKGGKARIEPLQEKSLAVLAHSAF